jgi:hypothetical protein
MDHYRSMDHTYSIYNLGLLTGGKVQGRFKRHVVELSQILMQNVFN